MAHRHGLILTWNSVLPRQTDAGRTRSRFCLTSPSKRLMRILRAIVEPTTNLVAIGVADLLHRRGVRAKPVGDNAPRAAILLHDAFQKLQRCSLVPLHRDHR